MNPGFRRSIALVLAALLLCVVVSAQTATNGQQIAVMKMLKKDLTTVGVMSSSLSEKGVQDLTRAGMAQGIKVVVAKPKDPREIAQLYKKLAGEFGAQLIWLPDASDKLILGTGFDFLVENATADRIGIVVPEESMVGAGALCFVGTEGGKVRAVVNQRIARLVGATASAAEGSSIQFVSK